MKGKNRMIHFDLLRIFAAFSVVMLHSAAQFWYTLDVNSTEWLIANSYDAAFRFGVPIFVMISGALFLRPGYQLDVKRLYTHNILRLSVIYMVWSCAYGVFDSIFYGLAAGGWKAVIREMISGRYHLWFLPMIIGIYMLLPILKGWLEHAEEKSIRYFLGLFLIFQIGSETLRALTVTDELHQILDIPRIEMVCSYIGYFVWGYYLTHVGLGTKWKRFFLWGAIPAVCANILLGNLLARQRGVPDAGIYDSYGVFTFVVATTLFLIAKDYFSKMSFSETSSHLIQEVSACTLGIYLMHVGVMEWLQAVGIHSMVLPNVVGIPVYAVGCFVGCLLIAFLLRRIPFIGKYLC